MYELWVFLHLMAVVIGIGTVFLNGVYANKSMKRQGTEGVAISEANFEVSAIAEKFIYAVPVFGIFAVLANDGIDFDQTWIWLSLLLYVVAIGISHSIVIPGHRKINELSRRLATGAGGPEEGQQLEAIGKRMAPAGAALDLLVVVLVALMVWKPGL